MSKTFRLFERPKARFDQLWVAVSDEKGVFLDSIGRKKLFPSLAALEKWKLVTGRKEYRAEPYNP